MILPDHFDCEWSVEDAANLVELECLNVALWLKADLQSPEIEVRLSPNFGHSSARCGEVAAQQAEGGQERVTQL